MRESRKQKVGSLKALIKLTNPCQDQEKWQKRKLQRTSTTVSTDIKI